MSCDESVIKKLGDKVKKESSATMLPFWVETKDGYVKSITEQFVN